MPNQVVKENQDPDPSQESKPSGSSEEPGQSLEGMRGVNPAFAELDSKNAVEDPSDPNEPDVLEQVLEEGGKPAAEEGTQEEGVEPTDGDGESQAGSAKQEVDDDVAALQGRLLESDKDRTRRAQESAFLKTKLTELDPYIQTGIAVRDNPELHAYVERILAGEPVTPTQQVAAAKGAKAQGLTPEQFLNTIVAQVTEKVTNGIQRTMDSNSAASRQFNKIDTKARKELKHYDKIQQHPAYMGTVSAVNVAIDNGSMLVPEGEDPNYFALKEAHDIMIARNPEYISAVHDAGVKKGKASNAKKMAGAGPSGASRGSTQVKSQDMSQEQKDRVGILQAYLKGGTGRRLPGAR